ncbi:MAG: hypothetical protein OHK0048_23860 [Rhodoferax sp.]
MPGSTPSACAWGLTTDTTPSFSVLVVKATQTGKALWVTSYRRLSRQEAQRDAEIRRLLKKERK